MNLDQKIRQLNHKRIDGVRAFKLKAFNFLFSKISAFTNLDKGAILVLRTDGKLGDSVTATGFLKALKAEFKDSPLIVLASQETKEIYTGLNYVDEVIVSGKGLFTSLKLYFRLKNKSFRYIINTSHILSPKVIFLVSLLKAFKKISIDNFSFKSFSQHVSVDFTRDHITDRYLKILKLLGAQSNDLNYQIKVTENTKVQAFISEIRKNKKYVVALNSFAGAHLRNLKASTTEKIVKSLLSHPEIVVLSLASEGDHRILDQWMAEAPAHWVKSIELSSLDDNIALLNDSDLIITPDTAWVHIASALNKKIVAIYREETNPNEINSVIWAPYKTQFEIVFAPSTLENPNDINNVSVTELTEKAFKLLSLK